MAVPANRTDARRAISSALHSANISSEAIDYNIFEGDDGSIVDNLPVHINGQMFAGKWDDVLGCIASSSSLDELSGKLTSAGLLKLDNPDGYDGV
jgi:hypothetical protein